MNDKNGAKNTNKKEKEKNKQQAKEKKQIAAKQITNITSNSKTTLGGSRKSS